MRNLPGVGETDKELIAASQQLNVVMRLLKIYKDVVNGLREEDMKPMADVDLEEIKYILDDVMDLLGDLNGRWKMLNDVLKRLHGVVKAPEVVPLSDDLRRTKQKFEFLQEIFNDPLKNCTPDDD